jgi:ribosome-associated toxin RatA of RatAB toxin-antitoxin module
VAEESSGTTEIEASPEEVMEVIADFEAYPEWAGMESAEILEWDEEERPAAVAFRVSQMGFDAAYTLEYEYEPGSGGVSWTTREAEGVLKDLEGSYVLEGSDEGTHVTYTIRVELAVPVPGVLRRRAEKRIVQTALEGLKRRVEEG